MRALLAPLVLCCLLVAGCDQLGIDTPAATAARKEADSKAIGGACRHAGRAIEDCYTLNKKADKAAMYAGWREMDLYMRENKLEPVAPVIQPDKPASAPAPAASSADDEEADTPPAKPAKSGKKAAH